MFLYLYNCVKSEFCKFLQFSLTYNFKFRSPKDISYCLDKLVLDTLLNKWCTNGLCFFWVCTYPVYKQAGIKVCWNIIMILVYENCIISPFLHELYLAVVLEQQTSQNKFYAITFTVSYLPMKHVFHSQWPVIHAEAIDVLSHNKGIRYYFHPVEKVVLEKTLHTLEVEPPLLLKRQCPEWVMEHGILL